LLTALTPSNVAEDGRRKLDVPGLQGGGGVFVHGSDTRLCFVAFQVGLKDEENARRLDQK
jgi:hypothetical protein